MLTSERFLDLVFGEALGQAVKDDKPACRGCKSWQRELTQWTVAAQNARPPRFWLPWLTFTRTQTARSQARKQTQIWLRYTSGYNVAFQSQMLHFWAKLCLSSWRQGMIDLWSCQVRSCMSNYLKMMCRSQRIFDLVFGEAVGQAVKHDKPACRRCKSWYREVTQWTVVAQNARPPETPG